MPTLEHLNENQKKAVVTTDGPLLVIAGAGSGKTKVLVHRIAYLIESGIAPSSILAVTFTNKAAREMKERIRTLLVGDTQTGIMPFISTFHALGVHILRKHGNLVGLANNFTILDEGEILSLIKRISKNLQIDPKQFQPTRIRKTIRNVYEHYEKELKKSSCVDFDDLLVKTVELLRAQKSALEYYRNRWRYMLVDEYQDTNTVQYILTKLLAEQHGNIMVVGDVDQAIYSWRGADYKNILSFEKDWKNAKVITLEQNYRSTQTILEAANAVIEKNTERKEKNLWTAITGGAPLLLHMADNEREESGWIAGHINSLRNKGMSYNHMAVLYRTNAQSRPIEEALIKHNIPYRLVGGTKFYERKEIKDILAYMRSCVNPDDVISKERIINTPTRGFGAKLTEKYFRGGVALTAREQEKISAFNDMLSHLHKQCLKLTTTELVKTIISTIKYESYLRDGTPEGEDRWANVQELYSITAPHDDKKAPEGTKTFLEEVSLLGDADFVDANSGAVHVMTIHAAKGLEFGSVFVAGLEEGIFPHTLSMQSPTEMEEERRLCYVALTRAKERLFLSLTQSRTIYGDVLWNEPSRFLGDIPIHLLSTPPKKDIYEEDIIGYDVET
jgi:DNA helicase II / ATP-dependent DNA helicase PcrA